MSKTPDPKTVERHLRMWIDGVLDANAILQPKVSARGGTIPAPVLKALADVDWACRALTTAVAAWPEEP